VSSIRKRREMAPKMLAVSTCVGLGAGVALGFPLLGLCIGLIVGIVLAGRHLMKYIG